SSTMDTPATSASRTSAPEVIILKAFATQVTPSASFDRLPFPEATTHGLTLLGAITVGPCPEPVEGACPKSGFVAATAATPAAVVVRTKSRRFGFFMSTSLRIIIRRAASGHPAPRPLSRAPPNRPRRHGRRLRSRRHTTAQHG